MNFLPPNIQLLLRNNLGALSGATAPLLVVAILALMAIIFLLKKIHPKTEWQHRFAQLVATKVLPKELSTAAAGFPDGWQDAPIWR